LGNSLQEQLLKAGLIDKEKANKAKRQQAKKSRRQRNQKAGVISAEERQRKQALAEKAARDRELNQKRNEARRQREIATQIRQLVLDNRHPRGNGEDDIAFHFEYRGKVKRLYVSGHTHEMITRGKLVIVNHNGIFELVPADIAEKVRRRNPGIVVDPPKEQTPDENDPYADYQVPDDLMW